MPLSWPCNVHQSLITPAVVFMRMEAAVRPHFPFWQDNQSPVLVMPASPFGEQSAPSVATPLSCRYSPTSVRPSEIGRQESFLSGERKALCRNRPTKKMHPGMGRTALGRGFREEQRFARQRSPAGAQRPPQRLAQFWKRCSRASPCSAQKATFIPTAFCMFCGAVGRLAATCGSSRPTALRLAGP